MNGAEDSLAIAVPPPVHDEKSLIGSSQSLLDVKPSAHGLKDGTTSVR